MTLPTGQISASNLLSELGRAAGAQVTLNETAVRNLAAKASGQISYSDLRGKAVTPSVTIANPGPGNGNTYSAVIDGGAEVKVTYGTDGSWTVTNTADGTTTGAWAFPQTVGIGANYYLKITPLTGSLTTNQASTWVSLGTARYARAYSLGTTSGAGAQVTCNFRADIATDAAGTNIVATASMTISAKGLKIL